MDINCFFFLYKKGLELASLLGGGGGAASFASNYISGGRFSSGENGSTSNSCPQEEAADTTSLVAGLTREDCVRLNLLPATSSTSTNQNGGGGSSKVPLFNHFNAKDWISKRAAYNKQD